MKKLLLLLTSLCLTSCIKSGDKTPLGWCVWEIRKHEGYEQAVYTYQKLLPYDEIQEEKSYKNTTVNAYIITTYSYHLKTEWLGIIEYSNTIKRYLNEKDIVNIDCDILAEYNYE